MPGASVSRCKNFQCLPRWKLHVSNICGLVCDSLAGMKAVRRGIAFVRLCIRNTPMRLVALYIKPLEFAQKKMGCFVEVVILAGAFRKMIRPLPDQSTHHRMLRPSIGQVPATRCSESCPQVNQEAARRECQHMPHVMVWPELKKSRPAESFW